MKKIYLAGGFYADNWQEKVKINFIASTKIGNGLFEYHLENKEKVIFFDPKQKERGENNSELQKQIFSNPKTYTFWDLNAIDESDIVFAFIDKNNPALGVIAEVGYAVGKNKTVILIIEENHNIHKDRYFDFLRNMVKVDFKTLEEGIEFLKTIII